ncbi:MAG: transposase family protein [Okeania sp. SIO2D1]|nr:transposase family protein [Okeania sp. SIO2D1]
MPSEDFARRHHLALQQQLELSPLSFPSDSTFRRIMTRINFTQLAQVFNQWAKHQITIQEAEWERSRW